MKRTRQVAVVVILAALFVSAPSRGHAQTGTESRPLVWDLVRSVLVDPTTYAPAAAAYESKLWDWKTSQPLLRHGWLEQNPRFTVSGLPNDVPKSYGAGRREIGRQTLLTLQLSVTNNLVAGICERTLGAAYPTHRKLVRTLSWVERLAAASLLSYAESVEHLRQGRRNQRLVRALGG